jgi:hypothetical protein
VTAELKIRDLGADFGNGRSCSIGEIAELEAKCDVGLSCSFDAKYWLLFGGSLRRPRLA